MEVKFHLELRVDYQDPGKNEEMRLAMRHAAQVAFATASLLADGQKPQVIIYSDDFYESTKQIELFECPVEDGLAGSNPDDPPKAPSEEMLAAMREIKNG